MSAPAEACRQLWVAVVAQALHDVLAPHPRFARSAMEVLQVRQQAEAWLASGDGARVCALAGLDRDRVIRRVRDRQAEMRTGRLSWGELCAPTGAAAHAKAHARAWAREAG